MRKIDGLAVAVTLAIFGAGVANAQAGTPVPGTGNSTQIMNNNREANANYNHVVASGDLKSANSEDKPKRPGPTTAATAADIKPGSALRDSKGVAIGTIDSIDADGAVVNTGQTKIKVPVSAFGKDDRGLLLGITAARFNELVAQAHSAN